MSYSIKNIVDELFKLASKAGELKKDKDGDKMKELARKEIMNFLMYLSASDGSIEALEAIFIKDYFNEQISPEEICQRIEEENIYSASFEQKAPLVLKRLVKLDNTKYESDDELSESLAEKYICLYEALGKAFIECDHAVSQCETDDLNTYIKNMRSFYNANYRGPEEATKASHEDIKIEASRNQRDGRNVAISDDAEEESLEDLLDQLNALIGLEKVKGTVNQLIHFNSVRQIRDDRGLAQLPITQHMVFYGNPGTGKTTVARLIAKIYHHLGILSSGHLIEVDRSGLVAGYVGHTALKVKEVVKQARGGVLFIDEAYALTYKRSENDFGWEVVDTLIKAMEDERDDLVVIVAGYPEPMSQFIESNPGLKSRFNRFIDFEDYDGEQLLEIYKKMLREAGYEMSEEGMEVAEEYFEEKVASKDSGGVTMGFNVKVQKKALVVEGDGHFANARLVRNYLETAIMNQADRIYSKGEKISDEELCLLEYEDVENIA